MVTIRSSDAQAPYKAALRPETIPMEHTPWFLWTLWALAGLLVVGLVYSFWRIAAVPTPRLDVPIAPATVTSAPG